jgi:hypothetical protein
MLPGGWDGRNALAGSLCGVAASTVSLVENLVKTQTRQYSCRRPNQQFGPGIYVRQLTASQGSTVPV